jgi:hypothetical protein
MKTAAALAAALIMTAAPAQAVPIVGGQGLTPNAWALAQYIQTNYPGVQSIGGVRHDPLPDHPSGRAVDIMVGGNTALGNQIYNDIMSNPNRWGISYALWQTDYHYDHLHITVN